MNRRYSAITLTLAVSWWMPCASAMGVGGDLAKLLKRMPGNAPISVIIVNAVRLDQNVKQVEQRFNPTEKASGFLANIKDDLPIGDWIDFDKPIGITIPSVGPANDEGLLWVRIADFRAKVKNVEKAVEEDGVWRFPMTDNADAFAKPTGDHIVIATSKELITRYTTGDKKLFDLFRSHMDSFENRDAVIHVNMEPIRPMILGGVAQLSQMAPLFAGMAAQQGGDTTMVTGMFTVFADMAKRLIEQLDSITVGVRLAPDAADATLAFRHHDGPIHNYLVRQKSASRPLLAGIPDQPYFLAGGYEVSGEGSPFIDYLFTRMLAAAGPVAPAADGNGENKSAATNPMKETLEFSRKIARMVDGQNFIVSLADSGVKFQGNYSTGSPDALMALLKQSPASANSLMGSNSGIAFQAAEAKKIGDVTVEQFELRPDGKNPGAAMGLQMLYGANPRLAMGTVGDRVRFYLGDEQYLERTFLKSTGPFLTGGKLAKPALQALPAKRNAVVLIDPAGILPLIGPFLGIQSQKIPPGPPIAVSVSLAGDPARIDLHVPFRAIERVMQAVAPAAPM